MGRAIDMEKDIDTLKIKVEKLENIVRGMSHTISETKHIDIIEETKEKTDGKKKTNDEGNDKSSGGSNKRKSTASKKNSKS
jgi:hypothetical protein